MGKKNRTFKNLIDILIDEFHDYLQKDGVVTALQEAFDALPAQRKAKECSKDKQRISLTKEKKMFKNTRNIYVTLKKNYQSELHQSLK